MYRGDRAPACSKTRRVGDLRAKSGRRTLTIVIYDRRRHRTTMQWHTARPVMIAIAPDRPYESWTITPRGVTPFEFAEGARFLEDVAPYKPPERFGC